MKSIYIYGANGHGLVVADMALACGYKDIIFVDDGENGYLNFESIKNDNSIPFTLGVGDNYIREKLFKKVINRGFQITTLVHPSAVISSSALIGTGSVVMPNAIVNAKAYVGKGVILNSGCVVEHECIIEDFVHLSPNVALAGNVRVGMSTHLGIGSSVIQGIHIGSHSLIGAGSVVVRNVNHRKKAYGNPCKEIGNSDA